MQQIVSINSIKQYMDSYKIYEKSEDGKEEFGNLMQDFLSSYKGTNFEAIENGVNKGNQKEEEKNDENAYLFNILTKLNKTPEISKNTETSGSIQIKEIESFKDDFDDIQGVQVETELINKIFSDNKELKPEKIEQLKEKIQEVIKEVEAFSKELKSVEQPVKAT
ncbi:hypothetical protein, partial [Clostridium grantii]